MLGKRNVPVKVRVAAIIESLPSDRMVTMEEIRESVRANGVDSRSGIDDYVNVYLKSKFEKVEMYRLKH